MKAYTITTAIIFALLTIVHVVRIAIESTRVLADPFFTISTIVSAALAVWALFVFRRLR